MESEHYMKLARIITDALDLLRKDAQQGFDRSKLLSAVRSMDQHAGSLLAAAESTDERDPYVCEGEKVEHVLVTINLQSPYNHEDIRTVKLDILHEGYECNKEQIKNLMLWAPCNIKSVKVSENG